MKRLILFVFLILPIVTPAQKFTVDFDYAKFNYSDSSDYLEIYYAFYQTQLKAVRVDTQLTVMGKLSIKISTKDNSNVIINKNYQFNDVVSDTSSENKQKSFTGNLGFVIPAGEYNC
ncbi:MAG TPA: hypothetical protein VLB50_00665, partial [Ignavibacteriaceae bacterium]|nr:hypothetical protein [Ignavibacteriaceae bacterium]